MDTPVSGLRERDLRNGTKQLLSGGLASLPYMTQFARRPGWVLDFLRDGGLMDFPNVVPPGGSPLPYSDVSVALEQTTVTWADFGWIRQAWVVPSSSRPADRRRCAAGRRCRSGSRRGVKPRRSSAGRRRAQPGRAARKWWPQSEIRLRSGWMVACVGAAMSSGRCAWGPVRS